MNMPNLVIAIPTYNRFEILRENIETILPLMQENDIQLFISDDSTDNRTEIFFCELLKKYTNIIYKKNSPSLGHDYNCMSIFDSVNENSYIWYLGDSYTINVNELLKIKNLIATTEIDFIFVSNGHAEFSSCNFIDDLPNFFAENIWYLTLSGATIYGPKVVRHIKNANKQQYKNFQQLGYILDYVFYNKLMNVSVFVNAEQSIKVNDKKLSSYWKKNLISVFCFDWVNLIEFFDKGILNSKEIELIKSHDQHTKVLSIKNIVSSRAVGGICFTDVIYYKQYIEKASKSRVTFAYMLMVSLIPKSFLSFLIKMIK